MFAPALTALTLLAQTSTASGGNDPATLSQAAIFIGGLTACAIIGNQVMGAMLNFRKLKGSDPDAENRYATKAEVKVLGDSVIRLDAEMAGIGKTLTNEFSALNRSIGVLEGILTAMNQRPKD